MTPYTFLQTAIIPALRLLPEKMDTEAARAMMIAIALQESRLQHRRQIRGPARGYYQFEMGGGVRGVLTHPATKGYILRVLDALDYPEDTGANECYIAIEFDDVLSSAFARLLLWSLPDTLPGPDVPEAGWSQYFRAWRPGRPHRESWDAFFDQAWSIVE